MTLKNTFEDAKVWADEKCSQMTLSEKCAYIAGTRCFYTQAIERLGISSVLCSDATAGVVLRQRAAEATFQNAIDYSTAFPAPIMLAASWNTALTTRYAQSVAQQCKANGIGVLLGPGFNLYRHSQCGRNLCSFTPSSSAH